MPHRLHLPPRFVVGEIQAHLHGLLKRRPRAGKVGGRVAPGLGEVRFAVRDFSLQDLPLDRVLGLDRDVVLHAIPQGRVLARRQELFLLRLGRGDIALARERNTAGVVLDDDGAGEDGGVRAERLGWDIGCLEGV